MKRLILMRHAKSDWSATDASDHERGLNPRGQQNAQALGAWLRTHDYLPEHILCSDAVRTRETLNGLMLGDVPTTFAHTLYLAEPDVMIAALRNRHEACILMLAHNPGSAILAQELLSDAPTHVDFDSYPTCATLVADFEIEQWSNLGAGTGQVVDFAVPRDLMK